MLGVQGFGDLHMFGGVLVRATFAFRTVKSGARTATLWVSAPVSLFSTIPASSVHLLGLGRVAMHWLLGFVCIALSTTDLSKTTVLSNLCYLCSGLPHSDQGFCSGFNAGLKLLQQLGLD